MASTMARTSCSEALTSGRSGRTPGVSDEVLMQFPPSSDISLNVGRRKTARSPTAELAVGLGIHSVGTAGFECNGPHAGPLFYRHLREQVGPHWQLLAPMDRQTLRQISPAGVDAPVGSAGRLTLSGCRRLLDGVQHPMARD